MILTKRILFTVFSIIFMLGCESDFTDPFDPKYQPEPEVITLNFGNTYQTIHHFGASGGFQDQWVGVWPAASKEPIAELLFSSEFDENGNPEGIGLSMWRVNIGDGSRDQTNSGFISSSWFRETECFLSPDGTYNWNKQAGTQWFVQQAFDYGVPYFTAWATTPPYFMTENGYVFRTEGVTGFNAPPENYKAYADFLAEVMLHYEGQGYNFEVVAPFNETQYEWKSEVGQATQSGTQAFNAEIAEATRIINQTFEEKGVNAKIMIPETAQLKYLYEGNSNTTNQLNAFFNEGSDNYIGDLSRLSTHVAAHSYFSNYTIDGSINFRESLRSALQGYSAPLDYWQTEYSLLGGAYQQGLDVSTFEEIDYALFLSRVIHIDMVFANATGWSFWTALNQSTYGDHPYRFNLVLYQPNADSEAQSDGTFNDVKNLWALGNYSFFIRPGMIRFEVKDSKFEGPKAAVNKFMISGYQSQDANTVVLVFTSNLEEDRIITFNETTSLEGYDLEMYVTSSSKDLEKTEVSADNIVIPAKSIVTLRATK